jgi:hypothetical protein
MIEVGDVEDSAHLEVSYLIPVAGVSSSVIEQGEVAWSDLEPTGDYVAVLSNLAGDHAAVGLRKGTGGQSWEWTDVGWLVSGALEAPPPVVVASNSYVIPSINRRELMAWLARVDEEGNASAVLTFYPWTNQPVYIGGDELVWGKAYPLSAMTTEINTNPLSKHVIGGLSLAAVLAILAGGIGVAAGLILLRLHRRLD